MNVICMIWRCFWLVRLRVVGLNYFKPVDLQLMCLVMDYITWSSMNMMNVNRDTVNDFSLIGRFEIFESNIHDTRLMHEHWSWLGQRISRGQIRRPNTHCICCAIDSIKLVRPTSVTIIFDLPKLCKFVNPDDFKRVASISIHWEGDSRI